MKEKVNIEDRSWNLVAKYLNHEANKEEVKLVEDWMKESEGNLKEFNASKDLLEKASIYYQTKRFETKSAWDIVHLSMTNKKTIKIEQHNNYAFKAMKTILKYAAVIVLLAVLGTLAYHFGFQDNANKLNEITSVEKQVLREVVLPDGSIVILNGNSILTYPSSFEGNARNVSLKGEAFFDIKPNAEKPFIIDAGQASIKVLGTSFNVNAYPETEIVEVVVETGKVEVTNLAGINENNSQLILVPGEKGTLFKTNNMLQKSKNEDLNYSSWFTHDLIFENSGMDDVIQVLNKSYHISILVVNPEINDLKYTGHFTEDQNIDYILEVISQTFNLDKTIDNDNYSLSQKR